MIGIIEFKKETHDRHKDLARKAKEAICELYESLHGEGVEHRIPREDFEYRRGRSGMRSSDGIGPYGHRMDGRDDYRMGGYDGGQGGYRYDKHYPPYYNPYPFHGMDGQGQFESRFVE